MAQDDAWGSTEEERHCILHLMCGGISRKKTKSGIEGSSGGEGEGKGKGGTEEIIRIHVMALDELVNVNSFFTGAVFIGLSLNNHASLVAKGPADPCNASTHLVRQLVLLEVLAFSCFFMSSLVAQGLKLHLTICSIKHRNPMGAMVVATHPIALRLGVLVTALGSVGGTIFLMLSIIIVIQLRLGVLVCYSLWSKMAAVPLLVVGSAGITVFASTVLIAFRN